MGESEISTATKTTASQALETEGGERGTQAASRSGGQPLVDSQQAKRDLSPTATWTHIASAESLWAEAALRSLLFCKLLSVVRAGRWEEPISSSSSPSLPPGSWNKPPAQEEVRRLRTETSFHRGPHKELRDAQ